MSKLLDTSELTKWSLYRALIAEFMGTLIFLYVSIATVIGYKNQSSAEACTGVGYLGVAWSFGATIFVLVYCTSGISGGHINPAVTFGQLVARKLSLVRAVLYIVAQCLGAICGVGIVKGIMKHPYDSLGGGANTVADGYSLGGALAAEIVGTFILVYTVFSATDPIGGREESDPECTAQDSFVPVQVRHPVGDEEESDPKCIARDSFVPVRVCRPVDVEEESDPKRTARDSFVPVLLPLPIGFAVFVVHLATIPVTGTGINPARSLGAAVLYNQHKAWKDHWIFWVGPLIGATVAALYHKLVLRGEAAKALGSFRSRSATV